MADPGAVDPMRLTRRRWCLSSAIGKTAASTRAEAVRLADEHGWLSIP